MTIISNNNDNERDKNNNNVIYNGDYTNTRDNIYEERVKKLGNGMHVTTI